jgi:hypothetical protein
MIAAIDDKQRALGSGTTFALSVPEFVPEKGAIELSP